MHTLILGGARSGKSSYALELGETIARPPHRDNMDSIEGTRLFIATAQARDSEMEERILRHRKERGKQWETAEEPFDITALLQTADRHYEVILIDCLTLWLTNLIERSPGRIPERITELCATLSGMDTPVIMVSNEVGMGIVPAYMETRQFRDHAGRMHQDVARMCSRVAFTIAGIPMFLKGKNIA